ncbi:unnamed protein product [Darwinula stevensoni]|uniref:Uncharacterized protein n=1 Tax=Darwinula stevensoni TaxID=69355 RepID=A0A7R8X7K3_9CRUS|nr:unnamed protein product [Darwinula stevensoni]CAG0887126.1 unnamed protein product [Darwinula stevensoni]
MQTSLADALDSWVSAEEAAKGEALRINQENLLQETVFSQMSEALGSDDVKRQTGCAKLLAELLKSQNARETILDRRPDIPSQLLSCMSAEKAELAVHSCRALANLCYESDAGRRTVLDHGGGEKVLDVLRKSLGCSSPDSRMLRSAVTGFILNLINDYEPSQNKVLELGVLDILLQYLSMHQDEVDSTIHILTVLSCVADSEEGRGLLTRMDLLQPLSQLLAAAESAEVLELSLELLNSILDKDSEGLAETKANICKALISLLERIPSSKREEDHSWQNVLSTSSDLLVLTLNEDECAEVLYQDGMGEHFLKLKSWLDVPGLQATAALAMANFTRNDKSSIEMLEMSVGQSILKVLKSIKADEHDLPLLHACLGTLRNLAIPKENKRKLWDYGLLQALLPLKDIQAFPVVFKLLGTLRLAIHGQKEGAMALGKENGLLRQVVSWGKQDQHPGVQAEASRLLAAILRHSMEKETAERLKAIPGVFEVLLEMVESEHVLMQVEALGACTLAATFLGPELPPEFMHTSNRDRLQAVLLASGRPREVTDNVLAFLVALLNKSKDHPLSTEDKEAWKASLEEPLKALSSSIHAEKASQLLTSLSLN